MNYNNYRTPSLKNSKSVGTPERQKVQRDMSRPQGMSQMNLTNTTGNVPNLSSSNAVGNAEMQYVKRQLQQNRYKSPQNNGLR